MKFTHQLKFNSVPEWKEYYINYSALKKIVYAISSAEVSRPESPAADEEAQQALLGGQQHHDNEANFAKALDAELNKCASFYMRKEAELLSQVSELEHFLRSAEGLLPEDDAGAVRTMRIQFWARPINSNVAATKEMLKARIPELYVMLVGLREFLNINREGFRKILKKHDKLAQLNMKDQYMRLVEQRLPLQQKVQLDNVITSLLDTHSILVFSGNLERSQADLKRLLKDQVVYERSTVWKDMLALERRRTNAQVVSALPLPSRTVWLKRYSQTLSLLLALLAFCLLLSVKMFKEREKQNCLALLALVSILWCTEALPLFVTSMIVPLGVVTLRLLVDDSVDPPVRMTAQQAAGAVFHSMFSQVIMLLLGGFSIAAALSKHFIAKQLAVSILSRVGRHPLRVLLANMLVATFASMWISNVAAPVLCFSLIQPILRTLKPSHPFAKSLVMGIALASNLGGMTSPISSPQNIFAIERMSMDGDAPSWASWFAVALPVALLGNLVCWLVLWAVYRPMRAIKEVRPLKPSEDPLTRTQVYVIVVSLGTVALWCCNSFISNVTGEMGVLAILPMIAFFGFGVLNKDDFNGFLWNVVMLAMGGLALGEAVKSSGLLLSIATGIQSLVAGYSLWQVLVIFCALVLVCTTFISHTVGAMVILPIVQSVGEQMPGDPHPKLLVMGAALMCSGAMGLPVSGFPNMNAVALEDATGVNYVSTADFLRAGIPSSIFAFGIIISLGYWMMLLVHF